MLIMVNHTLTSFFFKKYTEKISEKMNKGNLKKNLKLLNTKRH